jgi:hypothetical protein
LLDFRSRKRESQTDPVFPFLSGAVFIIGGILAIRSARDVSVNWR